MIGLICCRGLTVLWSFRLVSFGFFIVSFEYLTWSGYTAFALIGLEMVNTIELGYAQIEVQVV